MKKNTSRRIAYLDITRGFLFLLMTSTHALTLSAVPRNGFLYSQYWLPRGWATTGFIMLSGYTVAYIFNWGKNNSAIFGKLRYRAWQLLIVMFISNVVLLALAHLSDGNLLPLSQFSWWAGLLTGKTHYSISAILLPSALLLIATPLLHKLSESLGKWTGLALAVTFAFCSVMLKNALSKTPSDNQLIAVFITPGLGDFNILHLWFCGWMGFYMGLIAKKMSPYLARTTAGIAIFLVIATRFASPINSTGFTAITKPIYLPCVFISLLSLAIVLERCSSMRAVSSFFSLIGKFALFSFIMHRIILHSIHLLFSYGFPNMDPVTSYAVLLVGTMLMIWILCLIRERFDSFNKGLRNLYL
ncbi:MAG: acyltransferase [Acidobacteriota bacterium]|nr:acyltransferase [Acidobacteriota bacterium]NLT34267.1 acyltransferase [Acidobacteriota bacterium]